MPVDLFWHPSCLEHDPGPGHPESPARLAAILEELRSDAYAEVVRWQDAPPAGRSALERVHAPAYLNRLERLAESGGGRLDNDTVMSTASFEATTRAAGAAIAVARSALDGRAAFAATRPPGHHALRDTAMGFCLVNSVVVGARSALEDLGVERVLIVDWDVHHGNGTQALIEHDPAIRYVSMHQWPLYPGTGRADERGVGNVFNIPRPPGRPRATYVSDLNDAVDRAIDGWTPDLLLISAGFDALAGDPLAGFTLEPEDYADWVTRWRGFGVPMGALLEGGYAPDRIRVAAGATVRALA